MLFREKPKVVEASKFLPPGIIPEGVKTAPDGTFYVNTTDRGNVIVTIGDWLISEDKGYFRVFKDDLFKKTYERYFPEFESKGE